MGSDLDIEDRAARFCHQYSVHSPVSPLAVAHALDWTPLPAGIEPPRAVRGASPIYHCSGRRGACLHKVEGCDSRDIAWQVMRELSNRELMREVRGAVVPVRHVDRFARAVLLPADEFLEDLHLCHRSIARLFAVHQYAPEAVIRERIAELGAAPRLSLVAGL